VLVKSGDEEVRWIWTRVEDCVWAGPDWFTYYNRLEPMSEYAPLQSLFKHALGIKDVTLNQYLQYLESIRTKSLNGAIEQTEEVKICLLYDRINDLTGRETDSEQTEMVRSVFALFSSTTKQLTLPGLDSRMVSSSIFRDSNHASGMLHQLASGRQKG
jgi:hypothetical protein